MMLYVLAIMCVLFFGGCIYVTCRFNPWQMLREELKQRQLSIIENQMNDFIATYNQFEPIMGKKVSDEEFSKFVKLRHISEDGWYYSVLFGKLAIPVCSMRLFEKLLHSKGEYVYALGEHLEEQTGKKLEMLDGYKDFSERFLEIVKITKDRSTEIIDFKIEDNPRNLLECK